MSRITTSMLSTNYLRNVNRNLNYIQNVQNQLSTGKKISKPSDNPYAASRIVQMYADISGNEQYNDNITDVTNFLDVTDTSLTQMSNLLSRVRELLVSAGNAAYGSEQLKSIQDEMSAKVNQLAQILNTNFEGKYIFGGTKIDSKPVTVVDGKLQYADNSGNAICVYKDANGKFTTSDTGANKIVSLNDRANPADPLDTSTIRDVLTNEKSALNDIVTAGGTLTSEQQDRLDKLNKMLDPAGNVYRDIDGNYTSESTGKTKAINISDITEGEVNAPGACVVETQKSTILDGIKFYNQMSSDMKIEISQGVVVTYNKTATEILEFTDSSTGAKINVSDLFNDILNNLNSADGKSKLTGENLADLDKVISNLLSKTSQIGAMQNRMESAKTQNESDNYNLTSVLSNVEDIDFTETMIDFSTLMTVYKASLQISANILPKTIMDYL